MYTFDLFSMMKKKSALLVVLIIGVLALYYFLSDAQNTTSASIDEIERNSEDTNYIGDVDEEYLRIIEKVKKGETLTDEELDQIDKQRIRNLEKIDEKAARLEKELQIRGSLSEKDYNYLSGKRKELERLVILESINKSRKKENAEEIKNK